MVTKAADCTQLVLDLDNKIMRVAKRFKSTNDPSITMEEDLHQKLKNIADSVGVHLEIKDNKVILTSDDEEKCVKAKAEARFRYSDRFRRNVEDTCRTWDFDVGTVWVAVDCKISLPSEITRRLEKQGLELESSYREGELTVYLRGPKAVMASAVKILQDLEKDVLLKEDRRVTGYDARHAPEAEEQVKSPEPAQPAQPAQPAVGKSAAESKGLVPQASVKSQEPQVAEKDLVEESDNNVMVLKLNDVVKRRLAEDEQSANELKEYLEMLSTAYSLNIIFVSAIGGIILEDLSKEADAMTKACDDLKAYIKEEFGVCHANTQRLPLF
ncbi:hypothetical protein DFS34DRAFT_127855 [Phlyctochytrium arcticum]|nr:hypothetical protein DFS34DRAFT_127855 [Phlyctochytrium arcticum]